LHALEGLFDCVHLPAVQSEAEGYIKKMATALFESEMRRNQSRPPNTRVPQSALLAGFLGSIPHALAREQPAQIEKEKTFIASIIEDLVQMKSKSGITVQDILPILHHPQTASPPSASTARGSEKNAGCNGIRLMVSTPVLGDKWIADREIDLVRTLVHVLKDLPNGLPRNIEGVLDILVDVITISYTYLENGDNPNASALA
jgi:transformation/transcription domain-associated protein